MLAISKRSRRASGTYCGNCGEGIPPDADYCVTCGIRYRGTLQVSDEAYEKVRLRGIHNRQARRSWQRWRLARRAGVVASFALVPLLSTFFAVRLQAAGHSLAWLIVLQPIVFGLPAALGYLVWKRQDSAVPGAVAAVAALGVWALILSGGTRSGPGLVLVALMPVVAVAATIATAALAAGRIGHGQRAPSDGIFTKLARSLDDATRNMKRIW